MRHADAVFAQKPEKEQMMRVHPYRLICACCDSTAIGRQWWNRDTDFGLCDDCVGSNVPDSEHISSGFGCRGVHFATPLTRTCITGMLVSWKTIGEDRLHVGVLKEWDNGTAIVKELIKLKTGDPDKEVAVRC